MSFSHYDDIRTFRMTTHFEKIEINSPLKPILNLFSHMTHKSGGLWTFQGGMLTPKFRAKKYNFARFLPKTA